MVKSEKMVVFPPAKYHTFWINPKNTRVTDCGKTVTEQWRETTQYEAAASRKPCTKCCRLVIHALRLDA